MPPLFTEMEITTVGQYVDALSKLPQNRTLWYRGQTDAQWSLVPGLARSGGKDWIADESMLLTRFRQNAVPLVPAGTKPETVWDWLLLMQHYGVPTRLLDWSENALAGLYFAVVGQDKSSRRDGCVWVLDAIGLNKATREAELKNVIPTLGVDPILNAYQPDRVAGDTRPLSPVAVFAMRMFPRLVAQSAVFTLIHRETTPLEQVRDGRYVGRMLVPWEAKKTIVRSLRNMGITRLSMFPELESAAVIAKGYVGR